jgi:hypothetical protein
LLAGNTFLPGLTAKEMNSERKNFPRSAGRKRNQRKLAGKAVTAWKRSLFKEEKREVERIFES